MADVTKISVSHLERNPDKVKAVLIEKDNRLITTKPLKIYIPVRYEVSGLLTISGEVLTIAIFPLVLEDKYYALFNILTKVKLKPDVYSQVSIDGDIYYEFIFDAGTVVMDTLETIKDSDNIYPVFNEFIANGNIPFYMGYEDYGNILASANTYAGSDIAKSPELTQLLIAMLCKDSNNLNEYYRHTITNYEQLVSNPPTFVPLKSVIFSVTGISLITGSYAKDGIISALASPTSKVERLETLLRA